jgi:hypothetical protein
MLFHPTASSAGQQLLRGVLFLVACGLCGTFDILNNNFARWVVRASSVPEEEEVHAKDRATLVAAAQPARRGGLRPRSVEFRASDGYHVTHATAPGLLRNPATAQHLTGAGIFQHC